MQPQQLGKLQFRIFELSDTHKLQQFCDACANLGYENNKSFSAIKLDRMTMPYGQFFIGVDTDKDIIFNLSGVHHIPEVNANAYRVFYRGACLPGYTTGLGYIKNSFQLMVMLDQQINFILELNPSAEFYFTTNTHKSDSNAKSQRMDEVMTPRVARLGVFTKLRDNFDYQYTQQTLWRVNVQKYKQWLLGDKTKVISDRPPTICLE